MPEDLKTIFFVTAVYSDRRSTDRCWGWYRTKDEAWADLRANTDLFMESGSFDYAVIEELGPGLMACIDAPSKPEWIKSTFDRATDTYTLEVVPEPEFAQGIIGWSIG